MVDRRNWILDWKLLDCLSKSLDWNESLFLVIDQQMNAFQMEGRDYLVGNEKE